MTQRKKENGVHLPPPVPEDGYPAGDGPAWISEALGAPGCLDGVTRHLTDNGEETGLRLRFGNGREHIVKPARLVTTRRLAEDLGALGFRVPYYSPPQLALLGQAIGRVADRDLADLQERSHEVVASVVASWLEACLKAHDVYVLTSRDGVHVRAALEHVRAGARADRDSLVPLVAEPGRQVHTRDGEQVTGAVLAWTAPVTMAIRNQLGTRSDGDISFALERSGVVRERLQARPPRAGGPRPPEMPVWVVHYGWQGVGPRNLDAVWEFGTSKERS